MIDVLLIILALIFLVVGAITDIKTREVPDWVSYSAIFAGIGLRLLTSIATFDWSWLVAGALGLLGFGIVAYAMFYLGQWGGGDSKLLIGIGALIGVDIKFGAGLGNSLLNSAAVAFVVWLLLAGAVYGTIYIIVLSLKNWKVFSANAKQLLKKKKYQLPQYAVFALALILVVLAFFTTNDLLFRIPFIGLAIILPFTFYLTVAVSAVEKCCMLKLVKPEQLTEGDWIVKDVFVAGKRITGPKDLGISREQIRQLLALKRKGKIKKDFRVLIKNGIPFVPSFLIAYVAMLLFGNLLVALL